MSKSIVLLVCAVGLLVAAPVAAVAEETISLPQSAGAEKQILAALAMATELEFIDTPLSEVIATIKEDYGIEVRLDRRAMEDLGIQTDEPISIDIRGVTLRSALRLMLRDLELMYIVKDEVLLITIIDEADVELTTRVYPVRDLATPHLQKRVATRATENMDSRNGSLINLIISTINCESWEELGGPGSIRQISPDQLVLTQTQEMHEQVSDLLSALREIPAFADQEPGKVYQSVRAGVHKAAEKRIGKALDSSVELQFIDMPLAEVIASIIEDHAFEIRLDMWALEDLGISADEPITIDLRGVSLRSALRLMLRDLELTHLVKDEVLMITSIDEADNELSTVVYPVGDIVGREYSDDGDVLYLDFGNLSKTVQSTINAESWEMAGGPGSMVAYAERGVLVVSQTREIHQDISNLLGGIRAARKITGYRPATEKPDPEEVVVRTYWYHTDALIAKDVIVSHVEYILDVNEEAERYAAFLPNRIVVRQPRAAQAKLRRFLIDELKVCTDQPPKQNGMQGGGSGGGGGGGVFSTVRADP